MILSPQELESRELHPETLRRAVQLATVNGYVLFESVLPPELLAELQTEFKRVFDEHHQSTEANRGTNRFQMHLPFHEPFINPAIIENPLVLAVIDQLVGPDCVCHYFASDTALPGSEYQKVHADIGLLFPEAPLSLPPYSVVLNIPLCDHREDNGPLEIWPGGTHLMPGSSGYGLKGGLDMQELSKTMHSEHCLMPAGSLLIRDMRMWHRGTPNRSAEPRPNLALIYSRPWLKTHYPPIEIAPSSYERLSERARRLFRFENHGGK
jgi:ectoine hydroxylase-related dioxygenase (phytanoyl-CoA dioxygenase family)